MAEPSEVRALSKHQTRGTLQSMRESPVHFLPWERSRESKTSPRADRSPCLCQSAARGAAPTPAGPCAASGGTAWPGPASHSGARPRGLVAYLVSRGRPQRQTGWPAALFRTGSVAAVCFAGSHTARPPLARYAPSRVLPARVRHYAIPRPGTQPHPAKGPDWLSTPPAWGFRAFHWPECNAS